MVSMDPTPVHCPAPVDPAATAPLAPLVGRLADPDPVAAKLAFPLGTLQPDGRLDLCKQDLGPAGAELVVPAAVASPHATHLLLGTNSLGAAGAAALARALTPGHHVRTLYLGCNDIDAAGVRPLADRLATDATVRALWLKRNPIGDDGVGAVAAALRGNRTVRTLDLTNTGLTPAGLRVLVDALRAREVPTERLYLGGNALGPEVADLLAALLRDAGVRELYLACGRLGDDGARRLADALPATGRSTLGLGGNGIGPAGVGALAARLAALDTLDLARPPSAFTLRAVPNLVGDDGAAALAAHLPGSGLRRLDLRHTGITGRGARALLAAVDGDPAGRLELLGLGSGVPRRVKRAVGATLRPPSEPAADIRAIASVYR
jgi:Ran GTPase-activating protein (RanGAP) involved in mRNA processing and transport